MQFFLGGGKEKFCAQKNEDLKSIDELGSPRMLGETTEGKLLLDMGPIKVTDVRKWRENNFSVFEYEMSDFCPKF